MITRTLKFEKRADRELRLKKEWQDAQEKDAQPEPERGPRIDTSLYKAARDGKKPKGTKSWAFSLDGSRNGSVWILADFDAAVAYAKERFAGAKVVFLLP